jgi:hypothetical protein
MICLAHYFVILVVVKPKPEQHPKAKHQSPNKEHPLA